MGIGLDVAKEMAEPTTAEVPEEGAEESGTVTVPTFDKAAIEEFYQGSLSTSEAVDFIASKLNFTEYTTNVKESIQAEIYEQMLNYSKTCGFSVDQTEGFIGLFTSIITSMKGGNSQEDTETLAKTALTEMCETVPNFNPTIVKFMLDFLAQTVFQHYTLYSYVYQLPQREQDLVKVTLEVETARVAPLSEGTLQVEPEEPEVAEGEAQEDGEAVEDEDGKDDGEEAVEEAEAEEDQEPNPVNDIIEAEIARRVASFKEKISKEYAEREEMLLRKIEEMAH